MTTSWSTAPTAGTVTRYAMVKVVSLFLLQGKHGTVCQGVAYDASSAACHMIPPFVAPQASLVVARADRAAELKMMLSLRAFPSCCHLVPSFEMRTPRPKGDDASQVSLLPFPRDTIEYADQFIGEVRIRFQSEPLMLSYIPDASSPLASQREGRRGSGYTAEMKPPFGPTCRHDASQYACDTNAAAMHRLCQGMAAGMVKVRKAFPRNGATPRSVGSEWMDSAQHVCCVVLRQGTTVRNRDTT